MDSATRLTVEFCFSNDCGSNAAKRRRKERSKGAVQEIPTLSGGDYEWSGLCSDMAGVLTFEPSHFLLLE